MVSILNSRNLIYWWVFLTSFIFLQQPTHDVAQRFFRDNARFKQESFPFSLAGGLTGWIDDRAKQIVSTFSFDPNVVVIQIQGVKILDGFRVGLILILLLLILAFRFYSRAVDSPAIY